MEDIKRSDMVSSYAINNLLNHNGVIIFNPVACCVRGNGKASGDMV